MINEQFSFEDLQNERTELKNQKEKINLTLTAIRLELSQLLSKVRGANSYHTRLTPDEYRRICNKQQVLKKKIADAEFQLAPIKKRLVEIGAAMSIEYEKNKNNEQMQERSIKVNNFESIPRDQIVATRDKWLSFAEDQTRVNSMRVMAAQFARELTEILAIGAQST